MTAQLDAEPLTAVGLFEGIGGFGLALERADVNVVAGVEIDPQARDVLARHLPDSALFPDVTKVTGDELRAAGFVPERGIITAGFPCQDLSVAGRRAGLDGTRSGLWWHVVRLLDETAARWLIAENVPGLLSSNDGRDFGAVLGSLAELRYGVAYRVLDAQYFGVPQQRRRVFIVGHLGAPFGATAQVLFESQGCSRDSAKGVEARPSTSESVAVVADSVGAERIDTHTHTQRLCRAAGSAATGSTPKQQRAINSSSRGCECVDD